MKFKMLLIVGLCGLFACDKRNEQLKVSYAVALTGGVSNSEVIYRDANGALQTESLTGNWYKEFMVTSSSYTMFLRAKGNLTSGSIRLTAIGDKGGAANNNNRHYSATGPFDIQVESEIE